MKICKHIIGFNGTIVTKLMDFSQIRISLLKNFRLKTQRNGFCCLFLWNSAYSIWTFHCEMRFFCSCAPCLILPKVTVHGSLSFCQIFSLFLPFSFSGMLLPTRWPCEYQQAQYLRHRIDWLSHLIARDDTDSDWFDRFSPKDWTDDATFSLEKVCTKHTDSL